MGTKQGDKPRSIAFHWTANIFFSGIAIAVGIAFGEPVTNRSLRWLIPLVVFGALAFVPVTKRWEASAIAKRAESAGASSSETGNGGIDPPQ